MTSYTHHLILLDQEKKKPSIIVDPSRNISANKSISRSTRATCPYCWQRNHQTCLDCGDHVSLHHLKCKANMWYGTVLIRERKVVANTFSDSPRILCLGCWTQRSCKCLPCSNRKRRPNWDYCPLFELGNSRFNSYKKLLMDKGFKDPLTAAWYFSWASIRNQAAMRSKSSHTQHE